MIVRSWNDYKKPIYITENGASYDDEVDARGAVHDPQRVSFLQRYIAQVGRAIEGGADVRGYHVWSLMDNFEWTEGFHQRFGLVHVDFTTQHRTPKASFAWYHDLIAAQGD